MKAFEVLEKFNWTQGSFAKDKNNNVVTIDCRDACKFCAEGAIMKAYGMNSSKEGESITKLESTLSASRFSSISEWNDHFIRTKDEVIKTLKQLDI